MNVRAQSASINSSQKLHDEWMLYISPRFITYKPRFPLFIKTQNYTLKTATVMSELVELFRMRHHIFFNETGITDDLNLDLDEFDSLCDHLVIRSNATGEVCGTYRMLSSEFNSKFYSQGEFEMDDFMKLDGIKLELGRACIHPEHRNGSVIDLLWKGIGEYVRQSKAEYLFGCCSVMTVSPVVAIGLVKTMESHGMSSEKYKITPTPDYKMDLSNVVGEDLFEEKYLLSQIPSLLKSYVHAGAKVYGHPALDKEFQCIDFLTILDLKELNSSFDKRYFKKLEA